MPKLSDKQLIVLTQAAQREDHGLVAITDRAIVTRLLKSKLLGTVPKKPELALWETAKDGSLLALAITPLGLQAIGIEEEPASGYARPSPKRATKKRSAEASAAACRARSSEKTPIAAPASPKRAATKLGAIVALLRRTKGARLEELMKATGWQAHSVRGAISGALKSKQGLTVTSERVGDARIYRIPV